MRLTEWLEENEILSENQSGFRKSRSTMDNIFTISTIAEVRQKLGEETFAAFIDFRKAFDSIQHGLLWKKMQHYKVDENFIKLLQSMYDGMSSVVRLNQVYFTEPFNLTCGLRQGCVLSPTLFNLYINDLSLNLTTTKKGVYFGDFFINNLLYADDLVIFAGNENDLQFLLNALSSWCCNWGMFINIDKSAVIHFRPKNQTQRNIHFYIKDKEIPMATEYRNNNRRISNISKRDRKEK